MEPELTPQEHERSLELLGYLLTAADSERGKLLESWQHAESPQVLDRVRALFAAANAAPARFLSPMHLPEGMQFGDYRILGQIGHGGMSRVFAGWDDRAQRKVAIKLLEQSEPGGTAGRKRFLHELRTAAAVEHRNVVTLFEGGEFQGCPYLVMQYLPGGTLADRIASGACGTFQEKLDTARQLCAGFTAIHERGIVHRDIKPANVMFAPDGTPKITDFGISLREETGDTVTRTVRATPEYCPPERFNGDPGDVRGDIYSFGVLLLELFTGQNPFRGANLQQTLTRVLIDRPPLNRLLAQAGVSGNVAALIESCLAPEPRDRPATFHLVAQRLTPGHPVILHRARGAALYLSGPAIAAALVAYWAAPSPVPQATAAVSQTASQVRQPQPQLQQPAVVMPPPDSARPKVTSEAADRPPAPQESPTISQATAPASPPPDYGSDTMQATPARELNIRTAALIPKLDIRPLDTPPLASAPVPPPAPARSEPETSASPGLDRAAEAQAIRETLRMIEDAYRREDENLIWVLYPGLTAQERAELREVFAAGRLLLHFREIGEPDITSSSPAVMTASWPAAYVSTQKAFVEAEQRLERRVLLRLEKRNGRWGLLDIGSVRNH